MTRSAPQSELPPSQLREQVHRANHDLGQRLFRSIGWMDEAMSTEEQRAWILEALEETHIDASGETLSAFLIWEGLAQELAQLGSDEDLLQVQDAMGSLQDTLPRLAEIPADAEAVQHCREQAARVWGHLRRLKQRSREV